MKLDFFIFKSGQPLRNGNVCGGGAGKRSGQWGRGSGQTCGRGKGSTLGLTFWATWLTQGEVQLLRSGPRGFHMT